ATAPPLISTLFPYTTLFRSADNGRQGYVHGGRRQHGGQRAGQHGAEQHPAVLRPELVETPPDCSAGHQGNVVMGRGEAHAGAGGDRKSTRLNSSHVKTSYAV